MTEEEKKKTIVINGADIAEELVTLCPGMPPTLTREVYRTVMHAMQDALVDSKRIEIRGFGSFTTRHREGGQRRNPRTGEYVYAEERYVVAFRAGKELREEIDFTRHLK